MQTQGQQPGARAVVERTPVGLKRHALRDLRPDAPRQLHTHRIIVPVGGGRIKSDMTFMVEAIAIASALLRNDDTADRAPGDVDTDESAVLVLHQPRMTGVSALATRDPWGDKPSLDPHPMIVQPT